MAKPASPRRSSSRQHTFEGIIYRHHAQLPTKYRNMYRKQSGAAGRGGSRPGSDSRASRPRGRGRGGARSWQPVAGPTVGRPYPDSVLKAAESLPNPREPLDFRRLATAGEESRYSSIMPWQLGQFVDILREELGDKGYQTFVDVTAHIGGEGIVLAKTVQLSGTMIEIDADTVKCLEHNVEAMGLANVRAVEGNGAEYVMSMPGRGDVEHIVYADPPWGGPGYVARGAVVLTLGGHSVPQLVGAAIGSGVKVFVLKAPKNVDDSDFGTIGGVVWRKRTVYVTGRAGPLPSFVIYFFARADAE